MKPCSRRWVISTWPCTCRRSNGALRGCKCGVNFCPRGASGIDHYGMLAVDAKLELECVYIPYHTHRLAERRRLRAEVEATFERVDGRTEGVLPVGTLQVASLLPWLLLDGIWPDAQTIMDATATLPCLPCVEKRSRDLCWLARHQDVRRSLGSWCARNYLTDQGWSLATGYTVRQQP